MDMTDSEIKRIYKELTVTDKLILKIMAIHGGIINKTTIAGAVQLLGRTPEQKEIRSAAKVTHFIEKFGKIQLLDPSGCLHRNVADCIVKNYVSESEISAILPIVMDEKNIDYYLSMHPTYLSEHGVRSIYRLFRLSIIGGLANRYPDLKSKAVALNIYSETIMTLCLEPFREQWLESLPEIIQKDILNCLVSLCMKDAGPMPEKIVGIFMDKCLSEKENLMELAKGYYNLAMHQLFFTCGIDIPMLESKGLSKENDFYGIYGMDLLASGKIEEAVQYWKENIAAAKKATRKKTWIMPGFAGIFYIYLSMSGLAEESDQNIRLYLNFITKNQEMAPETQRAYKFFNIAFLYKTLSISENEFEERINADIKGGPKFLSISFLFLLLSYIIAKNEIPKYLGTKLLEIRNENKSGSPWIEAEFDRLLSVCDIDNSPSDFGPKGVPFLSSCLNIKEQWEADLEAIKKLLASADNNSSARISRMVWVVDHKERSVSPMEQKLSAKSNWSAGKKVSIKRLKKQKDDYMTAQDCQVIDSAEMVYDYYNGYEISLKFEKALPLLIGHPLVFEKSKDGSLSHVELSGGKPCLFVEKLKDGLTVKINPFPDENSIMLLKEPPNRLKVISFSDEVLKISRIIKKRGIKIPGNAESQVAEILAPASPFMDIHSHLAVSSEKIENIESDSTPNIRLYPAGAGIRADIAILPFGETGPSFKPGKGGEAVMTDLDGRRVQTVRNLLDEKTRAKKVIESSPSLEQASKSFHWYSEDIDDILELISELKEVAEKGLAAVAWPEGKSLGIKASIDTDNMNLKVSSGVDWFEIDGSVKTDDGTLIEIKKILGNLSTDSRFVKIGENEFLALSKSLHKKLLAMESASQQTKEGLKMAKGAAVILRDILSDMKGAKTDKTWDKYQKKIDEAMGLEPLIPSTLQAELRPYQAEGYTWLCRLAALGTGACLADDMGLGKTVQTLALLLKMAEEGPSLVVAPTSVCGNWISETLKFAPTLNPIIFGGSDRGKMLKDLGPMDLLIVSYGLMQQEEKIFENISWNVIVLDEAQAIKNETAKRTQTALKLKADFRLITTGTPVENSLDELHTLFSFINPGLLGSKENFNERYAAPIEREKSKIAHNRLKQLIRPFILRRLRTDVLDDLPEKTEIVIKVEPDIKQTAFYESLRRDILEEIEKDEGKPAGQKYLQILAGITKLRLASCHPELAVPGCGIEGAKTDTFLEIVEELLENRHKALIFSQFTSFLSIVKKALDSKGIKYLYLDGSTPPKQRNASVASFQAGKADFFLISLKAGGTGLNLTAANYVIHLDPWWNPAVEDQASARAHRMGQKQPVTIYRLVMSGSIEEKIMALHKHKRNLAESILEGAEATGKMSAAELINLIKIA